MRNICSVLYFGKLFLPKALLVVFLFQKNLYFKNKAAFFAALTNFPLALNILVIALVVALSVYKFPNKVSLKLSKSIPQDLPLCSEFLVATIMVTPFRSIQNFSYSQIHLFFNASEFTVSFTALLTEPKFCILASAIAAVPFSLY